jgi:hypothetical protein
VVTAPATFDIHQEMFKKFPWNDQKITRKDGMHVHIDRSKLNEAQIGKMFEFLYNKDNDTLINRIAGRNIQMNHFCTNTHARSMKYNLYRKASGKLSRNTEGSHGTALNISYKGTLEVRIFQSPSTYEQFMSNLEFVQSLIAYTSPGVVAYHEARKQENYLNFIDRKTYPNLYRTIFPASKTENV